MANSFDSIEGMLADGLRPYPPVLVSLHDDVQRLPAVVEHCPLARKRSLPSFEKALSELESIVERMEDGTISLDDSLKYFERGVILTRHCQDALKNAEQKVQVLMNDNKLPEEYAADGNDAANRVRASTPLGED